MHNEIVKEYNVRFLIKLKWNFVVSIDELGHKLKASNKKITLKHCSWIRFVLIYFFYFICVCIL